MTKTQAKAQLKQLHADECTCGVADLAVCHHDSKRCKYRMAAWTQARKQPVFRAITGGLYDTVTDPEAVAA